MRTAIARWVLALACSAFALPIAAQTDLYDNGPINGDRDAWTINQGFVVSDTFTLTSASTVNGFVFGSWVFPGDVLLSAELSITSNEFGGTSYFDQNVSFIQSGCFTNHKGLLTCTETTSFDPVGLPAGTYWLNLQNAILNNNNQDPVYWDENSGEGCSSPGCPSSASENENGDIPSESFTVLGSSTSTTTPEPGTFVLFGSGVLGIIGILRRRHLS